MSRALIACGVLGIAGASAAADLPRCENVKVAHIPDPEPPAAEHMPVGKVLVEFTIDAQGRVRDPQIMESPDKRLSVEVLREIVRWRFVPPQRPCRSQVPITFQIKD